MKLIDVREGKLDIFQIIKIWFKVKLKWTAYKFLVCVVYRFILLKIVILTDQ